MALFHARLKYVPSLLPNRREAAINCIENKHRNTISICDPPLRCRNVLNCSHGRMSLFSKPRTIITHPITMAVGGNKNLQPTTDRPMSSNQIHEEAHAEALEMLKEQVRIMVVDETSGPEEKMVLIDTVERLGVAYHFKHEIDQQIKHIFEYQTGKKNEDYDLFTTALHFRLLRQHGYDFPSRVFEKFKDDDGTFKKTLVNDINGLLSLYEATYLECPGEYILKEARTFAALHSRNAMPLLDSGLKEHVTRALLYPVHCSIRIVEACHYISFYDKQESKIECLLKLAKLNFNMMQSSYRKDFGEFTKWWNNHHNFPETLPFVRNIPIQVFFSAVAFIVEPQHSFARLWCAKIIHLTIIVNDMSSSGDATCDELEMFSKALQRWDLKEKDQLPAGYLQNTYEIVLNEFEELNRELSKQGKSYALSYLREEFIKVNSSYLKKAKWYRGIETPMFQDIVSVAVDCSAISESIGGVFLGMQSATEEAFKWLANVPKIVETSALYVRYGNDIDTYSREHKDVEYPTSPLDFYMKEHAVSKQDAEEKLRELADEAWMEMNKEWISTKDVPREFMEPAFIFARFGFYFYRPGSSDGFSILEDATNNDMEAIFEYPIPID